MERQPGGQQTGGFPPQNNQTQFQAFHSQGGHPNPQMVNPSAVGALAGQMQQVHLHQAHTNQPQSSPFPGIPGEQGMPYTGQGNPHMPSRQHQQHNNFGPAQHNNGQGMTSHTSGPNSGAPSMHMQGLAQNYPPPTQGPGMQSGYQPEAGVHPPAPPGPTLGIIPFDAVEPSASTPQCAPQGAPQQMHGNWAVGPQGSSMHGMAIHQGPPGSPQGTMHSPSHMQQPPYQSGPNSNQPDVVPDTSSSVCGIDPPEPTQDGGMLNQPTPMGRQGYPGFPTQGMNQGPMFAGQGMMNSAPTSMSQAGPPQQQQPPPSPPPPSPPQLPRQQDQMHRQVSNLSGQFTPAGQSRYGDTGPPPGNYSQSQQVGYGAPQMGNLMPSSGYGGPPQAAEGMQQGGFNQRGQEQAQGNMQNFYQGVDAESGHNGSQGYDCQSGSNSQEEQNQNQPPTTYSQGSMGNQSVGNQGSKRDQVPMGGWEDNGQNVGGEEEDDPDAVASRIAIRLMEMSKPNQQAFLDKVYDMVGHENIIQAMVDAFGIDRVKNAVHALKKG